MRRALDALYTGAAALGAACLVGLLGMVLLGIAGRQFGFHLPGTDAYAGYLMAACGFLALAHTLIKGEHIRVTLLLQGLQARSAAQHRALERFALAAATLLSGLLAGYSVRLAWQSRSFNDISTGNDATPLWIPQLAMAAGTVVLVIAFIDLLVQDLRGQRREAGPDEALHHE